MRYRLRWLYRSALYAAWSVPCNLIPVSWWMDHSESNGWRAGVWIWFHAILYGLGDRVTALEFERVREMPEVTR